ncbi:PRD domain-containing protein [Granulicatella sp. zg-ZJ]|uniref:BglG family transcription antiterminator n=1 Tax=unclassified Granulicatella TaxID=2630493 RepID=UPI0013C292BA|nr:MULTISPECIES: PRD domain-containing protein [unclassified Granulicatella]MBS4750059.1 transcription antiterminator [Carnobacteriaceae bacterium zg-ZUI78]NEW62640.1 PRD domain-containing protein [Granulicatella sp. zg-ZJ]NEW65785.1 PRD domain-containing protein [Granulicatella sp. zg-84]QMI86292.1 transcription antiterminator [Carnobacteriaceae bacterium zg-84]
MVSYLDDKTCLLINELLKQKNPISVTELARQLGLSRRVVYYHLEKINDVLDEQHLPKIVNKQKIGILLTVKQKQYIQTVLKTKDVSYILSTEERQLLLMFYIATTPSKITIQQLMSISQSSRNTILNDLTSIREYLQNSIHDISMSVNKKDGYHFIAKGNVAIEFMYALFIQIFQSKNEIFISMIKEMLHGNDMSECLLSDAFRIQLYQAIKKIEKEIGKNFIDKDLRHMVDVYPYLILGLKNVSNHHIEENLKEVFVRLEYRFAMKVMLEMEKIFHINFSIADIYVAALMLLSSRKDYDKHLLSKDYQQLSQYLVLFVEAFEKQARIELTYKEALCERLLVHFKVLIYRKKYNVFTKNPLKDDIKKKYKDLFIIVKTCVPLLEEKMNIHLNDDDISYLTVHFGGALQKERKKVHLYRMVLLTDEGVGIQDLLIRQCKTYISQLEHVATVSKIEDIPQDVSIDFIVTTIHDVVVDKPCVLVNPIFQVQDIIHLLQVSSGYRLSNMNECVATQLHQVLANYIPNQQQRENAVIDIQNVLDKELMIDKETLD